MTMPLWSLNQLQYNPCTGEFTKNGKLIGNKRKDGYVVISCGKYTTKLAHRLAWLKIYGREPSEIDHIDGNPSNNSIWNLREVSHQTNLMNSKFHRNGGISKRQRDRYGNYRPHSLFARS